MAALQKKRTEKAFFRTLSNVELSAFCGQMALILSSGLSVLEGVSVMMEDAASSVEGQLLESIYEDTERTGVFSDALENTGRFPEYLIAMVRIGEETGTLDKVMRGLSEHYDREYAMGRSIRSAVTYPLVMAAMMIAVIVVILVKVMPIFNRVFISLGTEMTGISKLLMDLGVGISRYSAVLAGLLGAALLMLLWCGGTRSGARFAGKAIRRLGIAKTLRAQTAACRLADGLALTIGSGLDQSRSLELAATLVEDPIMAEKIAACAKAGEAGEDLIDALHAEGIFSGLYGRLATIGHRTGNLEQAMRRIAQLYQEEIDRRLSGILAMLEPVLVIGVSLIVGCILMSVMLPLLGIMSGI